MTVENFKLEAASARLCTWLHPIANHIVIKTEDWHSMAVDRGEGDEEDVEYGDACIMLDKNRAIKLRNNLNELIAIMNE